MRSLKKKAASQRGASITFALLLFLVCAVVSSVIVVAASTAAGRMSQQAQIDQRYYAVSSAANLLRDDFSGKTVTLRHSETITASATTVGEPSITSIADSAATYTEAELPVFAQACKDLVSKVAGATADPLSPTPDRTFTLTTDVTDTSAALDCDIEEFVSGPKKQVVFTVSNTPAAAGDPVYTLQLILSASVSESRAERGVQGAAGTKVATVTTTIEWKPENIIIRKGTAA